MPFTVRNYYNWVDLVGVEVLPFLPSDIRELDLVRYRLAKLKDLSSLLSLPKRSTVRLFEMDGIEDISPLKNIPDLTFNKCRGLSNVSVFCGKTVNKLELTGSPLLTDVIGLSNVRTLHLSECDGLTDVSPLHGVYDCTLGLVRM